MNSKTIWGKEKYWDYILSTPNRLVFMKLNLTKVISRKYAFNFSIAKRKYMESALKH